MVGGSVGIVAGCCPWPWHWHQNRYSALSALLEPVVEQALDTHSLYHNIVGMVSRRLEGEMGRAIRAYERSIELDPTRPDTLYNFANLVKDEDPNRAVALYRQALSLSRVLLRHGITTVLRLTALQSFKKPWLR